ncbi:MAG: hypothetical protein A3C82_02705 [Candidatus Wildermuthbacteria bacterium RIFCSPHIGHO2_02_FULL_47_12]|uniref:Uncharacterized protein n=1 Tax=Candidatus Wildermuthbacteria bacterium RIFCSPHIGHO2_02_FULL_47_12 TaxID=1802451 RepID=A0A1G2R4F7_9BACT|nr:MAG: hypothetical protein A3C82_02705 [Candidatus Wildermuthbacteria bacterium RIFCSPHIGHO2_02_FULL_47_12]
MIGQKQLTNKQFLFLHIFAFLSVFALWGYIENGNKYLILFSVLAFFGALCEGFKHIIRRLQ